MCVLEDEVEEFWEVVCVDDFVSVGFSESDGTFTDDEGDKFPVVDEHVCGRTVFTALKVSCMTIWRREGEGSVFDFI